MRVRTGLGPQDWSENEPAVGRFHGVAAWGTRGSMVMGGTNRPAPTIITKHLRTPETASSKAARKVREAKAREPRPRTKKYASEEERIEARRETWRRSKARERYAGC